jgi:endothelin-converting enzyme/putative endopeptidase
MNDRAAMAVLFTLIAAPAPAVAQATTTPPPIADPVDKPGPRRVPGFDVNALDQSVNACTDFYQFACGGWMAKNPVPPDRARWGRFDELQERNQAALRGILEKAAASTADRQIADYYTACMDEKGIEALGLKPVKASLDRIAGLKTKADLAGEVGRLHSQGVNVLFGFGAQQDFKDATKVIAVVDQGGLGLPDRDYYLKDEPRFADVRKQYVPHIAKMFELAGDTRESALEGARAVMEIETALAQASLERVKRRDPANRYHPMPKTDLAALAPAFGWDAYFAAVNAPPVRDLNVAWPDFFKSGLQAVLAEEEVGALKRYLRWHALHYAAPLLPAAFVNEDFAFYGKTLTGAKELRPRWKRCVPLVDAHLGEALGQRYVEATFGAEGKERMSKLVAALERALEKDIRELPWMTDATRRQALAKLAAITNKIGYPDRWRDYRAVKVARNDALGNAERAGAFELRRQLAKIGQPVDRGEWLMTPPTVNAYYMSLQNNINFPAGILQPPFFERAMDDAVNFGAIGSVIGHELTHGFDDQGRKFAANGNLADWWTAEDASEFEKRAACFVDQYGAYTVAGGEVKLNGKLTLGENTADNGGVRIAYMALQDTLAGKSEPLRDGFTPEQRLFLGWGQIWCQNETEESARLRAQTDTHAPGRYRVNGVVSNMPEFQKAFACPAGAPMVRENPCRVW